MPRYETLVEATLAAPSHRPFITMWHDEDDFTTMTFGEFVRSARIRAAEFQSKGVTLGDTVILIMQQGPSLMASFVAAMLLGAVPSILAYPNFKVDPVKYRAGLSGVSKNLGARLIFLDQQFPEGLLDHVAVNDGTEIARDIGSDELAFSADLPVLVPNSNSVAFIQHSAGTTGLQKGVALSHRVVLKQLEHLEAALRLNENDRIYSWLPLYHDMGLIACFMLPLVYHLPIVMQTPANWVMRPGSMLSLISEYGCTLTWIPNFALQFLSRRVPTDDRASLDLSSLRYAINCSEPVRARSMDEFYTAYSDFGLRPDALQTSYAMAENVFAVTQSGTAEGCAPSRMWVNARLLIDQHVVIPMGNGDRDAVCLVSSGACLPGNQVRIVSIEGEDLPEGHVGEIAVKSDSLFGGYYNRPDLTASVLKEGWYWSGDLGFCLDGELYVTGRKSDLIIVGGKNIYPQDIEEIVWSHPLVHDGRAVAFGVFNSNLGTEEIIVVAEVENQDDLENAFAIERTVRNAIVAELGITVRAVYMKPPRWIVKSTAGKPARFATRQKLLSEEPGLQV